MVYLPLINFHFIPSDKKKKERRKKKEIPTELQWKNFLLPLTKSVCKEAAAPRSAEFVAHIEGVWCGVKCGVFQVDFDFHIQT